MPVSVEDYRRPVRLTNYEDYLPELYRNNATALPDEPHVWASTSGAAGKCRRVPYTQEAYQRSLDNLMTVFLLACSRQKGQRLPHGR